MKLINMDTHCNRVRDFMETRNSIVVEDVWEKLWALLRRPLWVSTWIQVSDRHSIWVENLYHIEWESTLR